MANGVQPYLFLGGRCEEALEFYRGALGAAVEQVMRFSDSPEPLPEGFVPPGCEDKIMHAAFTVGGSTIMVSDGRCDGATFKGFSLSISVESREEAERIFGALSDGGRVEMPLARTFWSPAFGCLEDRFGVAWMVNVAGEDE